MIDAKQIQAATYELRPRVPMVERVFIGPELARRGIDPIDAHDVVEYAFSTGAFPDVPLAASWSLYGVIVAMHVQLGDAPLKRPVDRAHLVRAIDDDSAIGGEHEFWTWHEQAGVYTFGAAMIVAQLATESQVHPVEIGVAFLRGLRLGIRLAREQVAT